MRTHEVRQALIDAVQAIEPDSAAKASKADRFWLVPADAQELQRDRAFTVNYQNLPTQTGSLVMTVDSVEATFQIVTAYLSQSEVGHARVGRDSDLILDALQDLEASPGYPQMTKVEVQDAFVEYVDLAAVMLVRHTVRVEFDPRDP